jgi:hypothetical protein
VKASDIALALSPFKLILTKNAVSPVYTALKLTPKKVCGLSAYANMEVNTEIGIDGECFVNANAFLTIIDSISVDNEMTFSVKEGVMNWKCGSAKGRVATMVVEDEIVSIKKKGNTETAWEVAPGFGKALELGAVSCDNNGLASVGLYGIVVQNDTRLRVYSSDNTSISYCEGAEYGIEGMPEKFTLSPEAAAVLSAVCRRSEGHIHFEQNGIFFFSPASRLVVRYSDPIQKDIYKIVEKFKRKGTTVPIPGPIIRSFIKRASVLAERQALTEVILTVGEGRIALSFEQNTNSSQEYHLAEALDNLPAMPPVKLNAQKLVRALQGASDILTDHLAQRVLVLRGRKPQFYYMLSGQGVD